jgi:cytochrome c
LFEARYFGKESELVRPERVDKACMNKIVLASQRLAAAAILMSAVGRAADPPSGPPSGPQIDGRFRKVILDSDQQINGKWEDTLKDPMELAVAADGRVFYAQRDGTVKMWKPDSKTSVIVGQIPVFAGLEDGMLGLTLDPEFSKNGWIYLNHSLPETTQDANGKKAGVIRVSRFHARRRNAGSGIRKEALDIPTQREECCHVGGSLNFDSQGNLIRLGRDNTNPFGSDGYSPTDDRPVARLGRAEIRGQSQRSSRQDQPDSSRTRRHLHHSQRQFIPFRNTGTRPEVYVMGNRNPFRISLDKKNRLSLLGRSWAGRRGPNPDRGPAGFDEVNQARQAGNFGWPYFIADNKPYRRFDFETKTFGEAYDPAKPVNVSPTTPAFTNCLPLSPPSSIIRTRCQPASPWWNGPGGRTAMAGPVYYFDSKLRSPVNCPLSTITPSSSTNGRATGSSPSTSTRTTPSPEIRRHAADGTVLFPDDFQTPDGHGTRSGWMPLPHRIWHQLGETNTDSQIVRLEHTGGAT